jgi:O-acetyl-ADP-ribose deacetylase (regulator of RNase III)
MKNAEQRLLLARGDITQAAVDVIVNAANESLLGGGGVDGAIHRAAGPELLAECRTLGGCPTGQARITRAYALPARHVVHTVGPVYRGGTQGEAELLRAAYQNSVALALAHDAHSIAFPAISCGVYGYPLREAAEIGLSVCLDALRAQPALQEVRFVLFNDAILGVFAQVKDALVDADAPR